jgi:hypothetical protein
VIEKARPGSYSFEIWGDGFAKEYFGTGQAGGIAFDEGRTNIYKLYGRPRVLLIPACPPTSGERYTRARLYSRHLDEGGQKVQSFSPRIYGLRSQFFNQYLRTDRLGGNLLRHAKVPDISASVTHSVGSVSLLGMAGSVLDTACEHTLLNHTAQRCGSRVRSFVVGAGSAQNNRCASKGRYSRTFDLSHCDH